MARHIVRTLPGLAASLVLSTTLASAQALPPDVQQRIDALDAKVRELARQLAQARAAAPAATEVRSATLPSAPPDAPTAVRDTSSLTLEALEERLDELDQQIRVVARQAEIDREAAAEKAKTTPVVTAGREGFFLKSADDNFQLRTRGYAQSDLRYFADGGGPLAPDTFVLRRVRPVLEGTLFRNFDFRIMPDFGGGTAVLQDAYLDLKFTPAFEVRAGKFKGPVGLERLISATEMPFVERAFPTALAPNRDVGVVVFGDLLKTPVADGRHWRISKQGYYYAGPFGVLGEYIRSSQAVRHGDATADLASSAWQVATSWVLTGEDSSYRGVTPRAIFDPSRHTWGALELTARYNALALDRDAFPTFANPATAARTARAWALGTNWFLNRAVKVSVDFENTRFEGGATSGDRPAERNVLTRFQFGC